MSTTPPVPPSNLNSNLNSNPELDRPVVCDACQKKIRVGMGFSCRCGKQLCLRHRDAESHGCTFDYRTFHADKLRQRLPRVVPNKFGKISL